MGDKLTPKKRIVIARVLIVAIGLWVLAWGLLYKGSLDIFDYMGVTGAIYFAGAFALLLGGLYWKRASSTGAFLALLAGSSAILGLGPVQNLIKEAFNIRITAPRATLTSIAKTRCLFNASDAETLTTVVVLPTPPFWFKMAIFLTGLVPLSGRYQRQF